jgi:protein phosphatase
VAVVPVESGDRFLICSDGLSSVVVKPIIERILSTDGDLDSLCQALINAANDGGGPDNITVAMLQVDVE